MACWQSVRFFYCHVRRVDSLCASALYVPIPDDANATLEHICEPVAFAPLPAVPAIDHFVYVPL